jgi:hypothetical protein
MEDVSGVVNGRICNSHRKQTFPVTRTPSVDLSELPHVSLPIPHKKYEWLVNQ